ncbi:MAG TPA: hypothetical protein VM577_16155 [Anaerovoracaceae bacterium]|nr:hypothetical protein [Anaerovoracaceae bacterium]
MIALAWAGLFSAIAILIFLIWEYREHRSSSKLKEHSFQWQTMYQAVSILEAHKKQIESQPEPEKVLN